MKRDTDKAASALITRILALAPEDPLRSVLFGELIKPSERWIRLIALDLMGGNINDADDVFQNTLQEVNSGLQQFRGDSKFSTWLITILKHRAETWRRQEHRELFEPLDEIPPGASVFVDPRPQPDKRLATKEFRDALDKAVFDLGPMYGEVFILRRRRGMSTEETAAALGISTSAVKHRLAQAVETLRHSMRKWKRK